jgi:hypothetical protein
MIVFYHLQDQAVPEKWTCVGLCDNEVEDAWKHWELHTQQHFIRA